MADKLTLSDCMKYPNAPLINQLGLKCKNLTEFIKATDGQDLDFILQDDGFKLILRSIKQLTDEERKHIDRLACINPIRYVIYESKELDYAIMKDDLQICDYLRSINIDIDDYLLSGKAVKG